MFYLLQILDYVHAGILPGRMNWRLYFLFLIADTYSVGLFYGTAKLEGTLRTPASVVSNSDGMDIQPLHYSNTHTRIEEHRLQCTTYIHTYILILAYFIFTFGQIFPQALTLTFSLLKSVCSKTYFPK